MFNLSRFSAGIFKILQSIKIHALWQKYLTVPQVVAQARPAQWKMCQHEEIPSLTWIFLIAQSDVIDVIIFLSYDIYILIIRYFRIKS